MHRPAVFWGGRDPYLQLEGPLRDNRTSGGNLAGFVAGFATRCPAYDHDGAGGASAQQRQNAPEALGAGQGQGTGDHHRRPDNRDAKNRSS